MDFFCAARRDWQERHVMIERVTVAPGKTELREVFQVRSVGRRRATAPRLRAHRMACHDHLEGTWRPLPP